MRRWLPFPLLWLALIATWLALYETLAFAHVILAAAIAYGAIRVYARLEELRPTVRKPRVVIELSWLVLSDIVRSNIAVGRIVLNPATSGQTAGFLDIPLDLRNPAGLAALACIITSTPGTAWSGYNTKTGVLTIHILDLVDEQTWIRTIKDRYERRLMEIFE